MHAVPSDLLRVHSNVAVSHVLHSEQVGQTCTACNKVHSLIPKLTFNSFR